MTYDPKIRPGVVRDTSVLWNKPTNQDTIYDRVGAAMGYQNLHEIPKERWEEYYRMVAAIEELER